MAKKTATRKNMIFVFSYIGILLLAYVLIHASRWSFYCADDFSHANGVGVFGGNILELLRASFAYMIDTYKTWQGTYFSMFLQAFLSPLNGLGQFKWQLLWQAM